MDNEKSLEEIKHQKGDSEFWSARELQYVLGYAKWENFLSVIKKAQSSFQNNPASTISTHFDHFRKVRKMVKIGSGVKKEITDYELSRYACYLIAQNGDPRKPVIAFAQSYFVIQTRRQEINDLEERQRARLEAREKYTESDKKLSTIVERRNVSSKELATIKSNGDKVLFGGNNTRQMKEKLGLKPSSSKPLADVLPTIALTAKQLANEMTYVNTERNNLMGFSPINQEHKENNQTIRNSLGKRGIKLEDLPPEPDVKLIKKQAKIIGTGDNSKKPEDKNESVD